ncbi:MAG TPA: roadblock/LC7 domain-containing protein [Desulfuromonadaceae bacterium]
MSLKDTLAEITGGVEGALAAFIMAYDGIAIEEIIVGSAEFDLQLLAVEYASVMAAVKRAVEVIKVGELEEVTIATGQVRVCLHCLGNDLFAALIIARDGNFGKGRYRLRLKSIELARELA